MAVNEIEDFFLNTIKDIESRLAVGNEYDLIKITGLLRLLFVDERPLLAQTAKQSGIKLKFEMVDTITRPPLYNEVKFHWMNINIAEFPYARRQIVNIDNFLTATIGKYQNNTYNIRDIIKYCANVLGGVHYGYPKDDISKLIKKMDDSFVINDVRVSIASIKGIAVTALTGMEPLKKRIQSEHSLEN